MEKNNTTRTYKTISKTKLAMAYGFSREETIVKRIRAKINENRLSEEQILLLGVWTGQGNLLPDQVEVIHFLLGNPQSPDMLFDVKS